MEFETIKNTPIYKAFSEVGKKIFLPRSIFYWAERAKKEAEISGTIGAAFGFEKDFIEAGGDRWVPCYLQNIKQFFNTDITNVVPYASIPGLTDSRKRWKEWIIKKSQLDDNKKKSLKDLEKYLTLTLFTPGITHGIFTCCSMFLNQSEYIILPNKRWGNYDNIVEKNIGAKIKSFNYFSKDSIDLKSLKKAMQDVLKIQDKIILILNIPNNPTGYIPTRKEAIDLINLLKSMAEQNKKPFVILCDDAYEGYTFDIDGIKTSLFYDLFQLDENIIPIKLDGITKELLMYGGRIGALTIGIHKNWIKTDLELEQLKNELENKFSGFIRSTVSNSNILYQTILNSLLSSQEIEKTLQHRKKVEKMLEKRYILLNQELNTIKSNEISIDPNRGGFFLFVNLKSIKATDFADLLLKKYKIGVIPIEKPHEGINGFRIAYSSIDIRKIPEFVSRIKKAMSEYE